MVRRWTSPSPGRRPPSQVRRGGLKVLRRRELLTKLSRESGLLRVPPRPTLLSKNRTPGLPEFPRRGRPHRPPRAHGLQGSPRSDARLRVPSVDETRRKAVGGCLLVHFVDQVYDRDRCFVSSKGIQDVPITDEHVIPKWAERRFNLWNQD